MFVDRVRIKATAGAGGDGCVSFRREKFVPRGGPDGGDGGPGGDVILVADSQANTLLDIKYHPVWKGKRGVHGKGSGQHGKHGEDVLVHVPPGTVVRDLDTDEILRDLTKDGERFVLARGGRGGKGNARFTSSTNRAPRFAEKGEPGEEREYLFELKTIADIGVVGLPNAGKSTFLSRVTAATPKIADYPFTTIHPNLGVVALSDYRTMTIADIPGIIEGAADGKGLGHDFLRHIERTKVLLFLIDASDCDPLETLALLRSELDQHSEVFGQRPHVLALSKSDIPDNREAFEGLRAEHDDAHLVSSVTGDGIDGLLEALWQQVERVKASESDEPEEMEGGVEYRYEAPFEVHEGPEGYVVEGKKVVRAVRMTDFQNDEAVRHLEHKLKKMGLFKTLKRLGAPDGASVFIDDLEMEYHPE